MTINYVIWWAVLSCGLSVNADVVSDYCKSPGEDKVLTKGFIGKYGDFELNLIDCNITGIEKKAFKRVHVQTLQLTDNKISHIEPGSFDTLKELRYLYLTNNKIVGESLDVELFRKLEDLETLGLSGNNMTGAPEDLLQGSSIGRLELNNCSLYDVPTFITQTSFANLAHITLVGNHLQKLNDPNTFRRLRKLWLLDLSENNIDELHENLFKENKKLRIVYLQHNKIKHLPAGLFQNLAHLHDVDLRDNLLTTLPSNAFIATTLESLYISHNRITSLPQNFTGQFAVGPKLYQSAVRMKFDHNPWQCACKNEFLKEVRQGNLAHEDTEEDRFEKEFANEKPETPCTEPEDSVCHREGNN